METGGNNGVDRPAGAARGADTVDRRGFLRKTGFQAARVGLAGGSLLAFLALRRSPAEPIGTRGKLGIVRPPGAAEEKQLLALCIRCTRCADACVPQCIRFFGPEAGDHQGTPYIVPEEKACTMCLLCGPACPTHARRPLEQMVEIRMGTAVIDDRLCVSLAGTGVCGACHTICPLRNRAITLDMRNAPTIHPEDCTGCGLCEEICIVRNPLAVRIRTRRHWHGRPPEAA